MTQDEIIELAKQAGFERLGHTDKDWVCYPEDIEAFAKLVARAERKEWETEFAGMGEWVETNNSACKILRQVHDMLALSSFPPRKTWVGLTGVEINHIFAAHAGYPERMMDEVAKLLKEKNNG